MAQPPLDPPVADSAPDAETLTSYDEEHLVTYLRLLDAEADGADWTEATRLVLHIDASREPARARRAWESHLARAKWMTGHGYQHLLRAGPLVDLRNGGAPAAAYPLALERGPGVRAAHRMTPMQNVVRAPSPPGFAPSGALPHHHGLRKSSVIGSFARAAIHKSFTRTTAAESAKLLTDAFVAIPIRHHVMSCVRLPHAAPARESAARGRQTSFACNASWGTNDATGLRLAVSDRT